MRHPLKYILFILAASFFSCGKTSFSPSDAADSLCLQAYRLRYVDADSARQVAHRALQKVEMFSEAWARAMCEEAFVRYQEMDYDGVISLLDTVDLHARNQVTLLCSDVLKMKVYQRVSDGKAFYEARSSANRRLQRIDDEQDLLEGIDHAYFSFARSEYHIISSTYYYYQEQDSLSKAAMAELSPYVSLEADTAQWLYYNYMMGSGGLVVGTADEVAIQEFEFLIKCYQVAHRSHVPYFTGNALQSLATLLHDPYNRQLIAQQYPDHFALLYSQHLGWIDEDEEPSDELLPIALARHALSEFQAYDDLFQSACVCRTLGELYAYDDHCEASLAAFRQALDCVNRHHHLYYPQSPGQLQLYDPADTTAKSIERQWIEDPNVRTVPEWMAGIRQQISMLYSALDMKEASDYNRNIYLDILESTAQNREMESRMAELQRESADQHRLMYVAIGLFVVVLLLLALFFKRLSKHNFSKPNDGRKAHATILRSDKLHVEELSDKLELTIDECKASQFRIDQNKSQSAEKRAKVALVQAVIPFLDRIINEVSRLKRQQQPAHEQLHYITELTDQIVDYNDILTEWIQMEQGRVSLHLTTVELSELFAILEAGHFAFDQKGVKLDVHPTDFTVKADRALTLFMLNTLADNARKFTPEGGTVTIRTEATDDYVELSVSDTGCGMSPDDIDTILNNKVYDSTAIGRSSTDGQKGSSQQLSTNGQKGFGFGLMNCKGIIEKYKKTSSLFSICLFGIESQIGKGSRFYFRLPRIINVFICVFLLSLGANAQVSSLQDTAQSYQSQLSDSSQNPVQSNQTLLSDSLFSDSITAPHYFYHLCYQSNIEGYYEDALAYGDSALLAINPQLVVYDAEASPSFVPTELQAYQQGQPWDYDLLINLRNEIAIAALALHEWEVYRYNNRICINLHKVLNQDDTLPTYCEQLQHTESVTRQLTALLVLFSILILLIAYMLVRRKRKYAGALATSLQQQIDERENTLHHLQFEENRLYVQNQVLDNCLSTIKHESMYYPSRIRQLAVKVMSKMEGQGAESDFQNEISQLDELTAYYKQLYTLLSSQAERQVEQATFRRDWVQLSDLLCDVRGHWQSLFRKKGLDTTLTIEAPTDEGIAIRSDVALLRELFHQLALYVAQRLTHSTDLRLSFTNDGNILRITLQSDAMTYSPEEAHNLFYPDAQRIPLLIVKQIVRDIDAMNNNPGLRLVAEEHSLWLTLPIAKKN